MEFNNKIFSWMLLYSYFIFFKENNAELQTFDAFDFVENRKSNNVIKILNVVNY